MFTDRVKIIPAVLKFPPQKKVTGMVTFDHFKEHLFLNVLFGVISQLLMVPVLPVLLKLTAMYEFAAPLNELKGPGVGVAVVEVP